MNTSPSDESLLTNWLENGSITRRPGLANALLAHELLLVGRSPTVDSVSHLELAVSDWVRTAFDALNEPLFVFEAVRDEQGDITELRYAFVNAAALRLYNRASDDVLGHGLLELFSSVVQLGIFDSYAEPLRTGRPSAMRVPAFDEGGVSGSFDVASFPIGEAVVVSAHDVTAEVAAQRALRDSEALLRVVLDSTSDGSCGLGQTYECSM